MDSRKLYELLLVVLTLHFIRSNQEWETGRQTECLRTIQNDSRYLIKHHVEKYESCAKIRYVRTNHTCIFRWTLNGSCWVLHDIQQMIRESSMKCAYKLPLQYPVCSRASFLACWCGFISWKSEEKQPTNMF